MNESFLEDLRTNPADLEVWLIFADWLEDQSDTGSPARAAAEFIRLSLELATSRVYFDEGSPNHERYSRSYDECEPTVRDLLAEYRAGLPTRFRVTNRFHIGENPPREMFGYARTIASGYLETGRITRGLDMGVGVNAIGHPRRVQMIAGVRADNLDELAAGCEPHFAGIGWLGHLDIEPGDVLEANAPTPENA